MNPHFDTVVIGGGQGASLARMLAQGGQRVAVVEKRFVGGSCTNVGCTPTKAHIAASKSAHSIRVAKKFGVHAHLGSVDMRAVVARTRAIVEEFRHENEQHLLQVEGLKLIYGNARFIAPERVEVELRDRGSESITADHFVVAVGAKAEIPEIEGLGDVPFMTHVEALQLEVVPSHLLILGGGYISCEFAQMFARFGSRITIVQTSPQLLPREDKDVASAVADVLRDSGVEILLGSEVTRLRKAGHEISATIEEEERRFSHLLVATGQKPQTTTLGLDVVGVELDDEGYIRTNEHLETSSSKIYALGDCKGGPQFTHIAYDDARILRDGLLDGQWRSINDRPVPYTVFIDPQLGRIGLSESEAEKAGKKFDVVRLQMKDTARGVETGQAQGFWKVLVEQGSQQILGGAFLSGEGGETMAVVQMAMMGKIPYTVVRDAIFAHPTWAESLNNVFLRFHEQVEAEERECASGESSEERCHTEGAFGE